MSKEQLFMTNRIQALELEKQELLSKDALRGSIVSNKDNWDDLQEGLDGDL